MASRMLHYVIAYKVSNALSIKDKERFYVGTLIPDLSSHEDGSYSKAHFLNKNYKNCEVVEKRFDWYLFEEQYGDKLLEDSLYLGYLCHLISDEVWFKKITDRYVRIYPKKDRITYIKKGYEDFRKLNTLLIEKYDLQNPNLSMLEIELEEVKVNLLGQLLEDFEKDFVVNGRFEKDDLLIYPYDAIMEFLDESIEICIKKIRNLMKQYILYHGSAIKDLKEIKANAYSHTNNKNVAYFTEDRVYALICCRKREENFVTMGLRDGKQHYFERFPNQLEVLYKGKVGYLYKIFDNKNLVHTTMHTWESDTDITIDEYEVIEDVYQEILYEEKQGNVIIHRYEEIEPTEQKMHANYIRDHIDDESNAKYREFLIKHFSVLWD